ncbi:hypothetical protein CK203_093715 [Vitis vinifera]|uniref:5'-nucleotidase n=1 Tax=Vitis vinifera TaxID=29760 RepID=A0A438D1Z3_VITVI|nr:hypothetical protein CK203_093715 [Vitis vinifera]
MTGKRHSSSYFSAGLADVIEEVLRQKLHRSFKNIKIVSNRMIFDGDGHLVSFKGILLIAMFLVRLCLHMGGRGKELFYFNYPY